MGYSDLDPSVHERRPWNAGQNVGPKRPLKPRDIWAIRFYLDEHKRLRDRALFDLAHDSKLRGCDLVKIRIGDITSGGHIRNRSTVIQQKTGRPVQFEIMTEARKSLEAWLERRRGTVLDFAFPSRIDYLGPLEHAAVCPSGRRMGLDRWIGQARVRHPFAATDESLADLQGDRQFASRPDPAGPHQYREYGPVSWRRHRRCAHFV